MRVEERTEGGSTAGAEYRRQHWWLAVVLGVTLLTYLPTVAFQFVYDDLGQIVANPAVKSANYIPGYFGGEMWAGVFHGAPGSYYRPLSLLWLLLEFKLFGLRPWGWHLLSVLLQVAVTGLVYLVARRLVGSVQSAVSAALLFGVHPVHAEVGAWISGAPDALCALLVLAAFLAYLRWHDCGSVRWLGCSLGLYALALLSKETAFFLPVLVFAHAWLQCEARRKWPRMGRAALAGAPFVPVLLAYLGVRVWALHGFSHPQEQISWMAMVLTWPSLLWFYLKHLLLPVGLSEFYDFSYVTGFGLRAVVLPGLGVLAAILGCLYWARKTESKTVALALVWGIVFLAPALNLRVFFSWDLAHDRYLYLPSVGFALLLAIGLQRLDPGKTRWAGWPVGKLAALGLLTVLYCLGTAYASVFWWNSTSLYTRGVQVAPHNPIARNNLGRELLDAGHYAEAAAAFQQVIQEHPHLWLGYFNLGYMSYQTGEPETAERYLRQALALYPDGAGTYAYLGLSELQQGKVAEAERDVRHALALDPRGAGYHLALAIVLQQKGGCAEALPEFRLEEVYHPGNPTVQEHLKACQQGQP